MEIVRALFLAYSLSGAAGIRTCWVMVIVSWSVHFGYLHPPDSLLWVGSWGIIFVSVLGSLVDFVGDKIPALDHALHAIHLGLAPAVGAVAAVSGYHGDAAMSLVLAAIGGGNAFALHSARATLRTAATVTTFGMGNTVLSFLEDLAAICFIVAALVAPVLTAAALLCLTIWIFKKVGNLVAFRRR